jgi:hypothetical protein
VLLRCHAGTSTSYQWLLNGVSIWGATSSNYYASVAGTYTCWVTNTCGSTTSNAILLTVLSGTPNTPGTITGNNRPCPGAVGITYTISSVPGATGYNWTVPSTATIISGQGSTSITVYFATYFIAGTVSVKAVNPCGSSNIRTKFLLFNAHCRFILKTSSNTQTGFDAVVYPNPSSDHFTLKISSEHTGNCMLIVTDVTGREISKKMNVPANELIDFGYDLASGIYFAEVIQDDHKIILRIIKNE